VSGVLSNTIRRTGTDVSVIAHASVKGAHPAGRCSVMGMNRLNGYVRDELTSVFAGRAHNWPDPVERDPASCVTFP
jgi:hypothetical protein